MSLDLPTGKLFQKKLLYVQHVDESKPLTTEIPISELKFNVLYNSLKLRDAILEFPSDKSFHTDDVLGILKNYLKDPITNIRVYSNPLPSLPDVSVLIHAFAVFKTKPIPSIAKEMWWSLEKNGKYIILQQSTNEKDVVDTTFDVNENKMNRRLLPVKELISAKGNGDLENILESLIFSNQLELLYHLWSANCQRFASYIFKKANGEGKT